MCGETYTVGTADNVVVAVDDTTRGHEPRTVVEVERVRRDRPVGNVANVTIGDVIIWPHEPYIVGKMCARRVIPKL